MSGFSSGIVAIAVCDRCKMKVNYSALRADGDKPGLRVCAECCDVKDPWRLPRPRDKPITLRFPRPDLSLTINTNHLVCDPIDPGMRNEVTYITTESGQRIIPG